MVEEDSIQTAVELIERIHSDGAKAGAINLKPVCGCIGRRLVPWNRLRLVVAWSHLGVGVGVLGSCRVCATAGWFWR